MSASTTLNTTQLLFTSDGTTISTGLVGSTDKVQLIGSAGSGDVQLNGILAPANANDAATKGYVDGLVSGVLWKDPVVAASTANVVLASAVDNGKSLDGVVLSTGDRILLKDQTTATENGLWVVVASGAPSRPADFPIGGSASRTAVFTTGGSTLSNKVFVCNTLPPSDVINTNNLNFVLINGGGGSVTAGNGLSQVNQELSVNVDNTSIQITADTLEIKPGGVSNADLTNDSLTVTAGDGLSGAGEVALGAAVTMTVDTTVIRTTTAQSLGGVKTFADQAVFTSGSTNAGAVIVTNSTASTSSTTGSVKTAGGLGVALDTFIGGECSATVFNATSDATMKSNITPISDPLQKLKDIEGYNFQWKKNNQHQSGVLAQDLLQSKNFDYLVNRNGDGKLAVNYNGLVGFLISAVNQLTKEVEDLKKT